MATPAQDPFSEFQHEIKVLRERVDDLQIKAAEKRSVWYKQPSLLISIAALLVSTSTTIGTLVFQDRAKNLADLQQLTMDIVDTNKQALDIDYSKDPAKAGQISSMYNNKRQIMIARAMDLMRRLHSVPPDVLLTIGSQEQMDGLLDQAESMYQRAAEQNSSKMAKLTAYRSLGMLYMLPGTGVRNLDRGRQQFAALIALLGDNKDDASIWLRAQNYQAWGDMEFVNDQVPQGMQAYAQAEQWFNALPLANASRLTALNSLAQDKIAHFRNTSAARNAATKLQGVWRGSDGNVALQLTVTGADPNAIPCTLTTSSGNPNPTQPPVTTYGSIAVDDDNLADMTISIPPIPGGALNPTTFFYKLRLADSGKTLQLQPAAAGAKWITLNKN